MAAGPAHDLELEWPMSSTKVQTFRLRGQLEAGLAARISPCDPPEGAQG